MTVCILLLMLKRACVCVLLFLFWHHLKRMAIHAPLAPFFAHILSLSYNYATYA